MGGSGGFFRGTTKPEELFKKVRDSESATRDAAFETEVAQLAGCLLTKYNQRKDEIQQHLETIKKAIEKDIDGTVDLLFGGSVSRHTYVDGLSDVDALVILNKSELRQGSPEEAKDYFLDQLNNRLPNTVKEKGTLAVTVKYADIDIQLLPAIGFKGGLKISDSSGKQWSFIKPREFAKRLTDLNQTAGGMLVPTIKMAKSVMDGLPKNRQLKSYHTEAIAVKVFEKYDGSKTLKSMLTHFFCNASGFVRTPIEDKTGQSTHVDSYLGSTDSLQRRIVADSLARIGQRMRNADGAQSVAQWREILGGL